MNRDLLIGLLISATVHGGFLFGEKLMSKKAPPAKVAEVVETIELMEMPPVEPEEPDPVESEEPPSEEIAEMAPPMAADVPSVVTIDSFVQKLQPPPPPGMERPTGAITIPTGRPNTGNIGQGMKDLFDLANLDQQPQPRFQAKPNYPFEMRRAVSPATYLSGSSSIPTEMFAKLTRSSRLNVNSKLRRSRLSPNGNLSPVARVVAL